MRVISQDGNFDLNYENATLEISESNSVFAYTDATQPRQIARYSSREKVLKAMEMLLTTYTNFQTYKDNRGNYFAFNYPKRFRFPADEDLEV